MAEVLNGLGFLDLTNLENKDSDDILNANINESGDVNIPVPGGLSEKPGGAKGDVSIPVPSTTTITDKQYKDAITSLQKSFKEACEFMEVLAGATVVHESVEDQQYAYVENAVAEAILEAYDNGPIFEAVDRSDKNTVKKIVKELRTKLKSALDKDKIDFRNTKAITTILANAGLGAGMNAIRGAAAGAAGAAVGAIGGAIGGAVSASLSFWNTRMWQIVGVMNIEDANVKEVFDDLNEKFKDDLGDYKLLYVKTIGNVFDLFRNKFGWKNHRNTYFVLVDKKVPSEIKKMQEEISKELKEKENDSKSDDK